MKIVIVGPGAMGCLVAAFLSKTGNEIWLLDKKEERARTISEKGIRVEGESVNWSARVPATCSTGIIKSADLIIICTKSYDTKQAVKNAADLIGEKTCVLTLQNGIGNIEIIASIAGKDRVIGGTTGCGATLLDDGHIRHAGTGETVIGRTDGDIPSVMHEIRDIFIMSGMDTRISRDIHSLIWSKLIINAGINALTAITRLENGRLIEIEDAVAIMEECVAEAVKVAEAKNIQLIYDDLPSKVRSVCETTSSNVSSMLQDVLREKRTEIDCINGAIVREGRAMGIKTPVNGSLVRLVKTIEQSYHLRLR